MEFKLSKIYLKDFINVLIDIYYEGADYIDIVGCPDDEQDLVKIEIKKEYLCIADEIEEREKEREEEIKEEITKGEGFYTKLI